MLLEHLHKRPSIGIFDSGLGGLSLLVALRKKAPWIPLIYVADGANFPYGNKEPKEILRLSQNISHFLVEKGVSSILCGCNTASSSALAKLEKTLPIPILGVIEPGVTAITKDSSIERVGIVATMTTIRLGKHKELLALHSPHIKVFGSACPKLAPAVEKGDMYKKNLSPIIQSYVAPLIKERIDSLLLACTHYSFLRSYFIQSLPSSCRIIDPVESCLETLFFHNPAFAIPSHHSAECLFYTTGHPEQLRRALTKLMPFSFIHPKKIYLG